MPKSKKKEKKDKKKEKKPTTRKAPTRTRVITKVLPPSVPRVDDNPLVQNELRNLQMLQQRYLGLQPQQTLVRVPDATTAYSTLREEAVAQQRKLQTQNDLELIKVKKELEDERKILDAKLEKERDAILKPVRDIVFTAGPEELRALGKVAARNMKGFERVNFDIHDYKGEVDDTDRKQLYDDIKKLPLDVTLQLPTYLKREDLYPDASSFRSSRVDQWLQELPRGSPSVVSINDSEQDLPDGVSSVSGFKNNKFTLADNSTQTSYPLLSEVSLPGAEIYGIKREEAIDNSTQTRTASLRDVSLPGVEIPGRVVEPKTPEGPGKPPAEVSLFGGHIIDQMNSQRSRRLAVDIPKLDFGSVAMESPRLPSTPVPAPLRETVEQLQNTPRKNREFIPTPIRPKEAEIAIPSIEVEIQRARSVQRPVESESSAAGPSEEAADSRKEASKQASGGLSAEDLELLDNWTSNESVRKLDKLYLKLYGKTGRAIMENKVEVGRTSGYPATRLKTDIMTIVKKKGVLPPDIANSK